MTYNFFIVRKLQVILSDSKKEVLLFYNSKSLMRPISDFFNTT